MHDTLSHSDIAAAVLRTAFYLVPESTLTLCFMYLKNGAVVIGQSACVSKEVFDPVKGQELAYKNGLDKVWELEVYLLREKLHILREPLRFNEGLAGPHGPTTLPSLPTGSDLAPIIQSFDHKLPEWSRAPLLEEPIKSVVKVAATPVGFSAPTVSRMVHYFPREGANSLFHSPSDEPLAGIICHVIDSRMVNLIVFTQDSEIVPLLEVTMVHAGDRYPHDDPGAGGYCCWPVRV